MNYCLILNENFVSLSLHNLLDHGAFLDSILVCFPSTQFLRRRNSFRKKILFLLYQNQSISKKAFCGLTCTTEELLCGRIPKTYKLWVRNSFILKGQVNLFRRKKKKISLRSPRSIFKTISECLIKSSRQLE